MKTQSQLTKIIGTVALLMGVIFIPSNVEPLGFNSPFTQDVEIFMSSQFSGPEAKLIDNQEEMFLELLAEVEQHPDLLEALPSEIQAEIKIWQMRGKSL